MLKGELIPTPEDWYALQGGKPRVFANPHSTIFDVVHVYSQEWDSGAADPNEGNLRHYGCVIDTLGEKMRDSLDNPIEIEFVNPYLREQQRRIVRVPATMLIEHHGNACSDMSKFAGAERDDGLYEILQSERDLKSYQISRSHLGWNEQRLAVNPETDGYRLMPLHPRQG